MIYASECTLVFNSTSTLDGYFMVLKWANNWGRRSKMWGRVSKMWGRVSKTWGRGSKMWGRVSKVGEGVKIPSIFQCKIYPRSTEKKTKWAGNGGGFLIPLSSPIQISPHDCWHFQVEGFSGHTPPYVLHQQALGTHPHSHTTAFQTCFSWPWYSRHVSHALQACPGMSNWNSPGSKNRTMMWEIHVGDHSAFGIHSETSR